VNLTLIEKENEGNMYMDNSDRNDNIYKDNNNNEDRMIFLDGIF
jgi:hypothetical protein